MEFGIASRDAISDRGPGWHGLSGDDVGEIDRDWSVAVAFDHDLHWAPRRTGAQDVSCPAVGEAVSDDDSGANEVWPESVLTRGDLAQSVGFWGLCHVGILEFEPEASFRALFCV